MVAKEVTSVRIMPDQIKMLDEYGKVFGKNRSEMIEESINILLQTYHKNYGTPEEISNKKLGK